MGSWLTNPYPMCSDSFYIAHRVTYRYYVGRKAMFDGEDEDGRCGTGSPFRSAHHHGLLGRYTEAETHLKFALEHCNNSSPRNKRLILIYLIPVKVERRLLAGGGRFLRCLMTCPPQLLSCSL